MEISELIFLLTKEMQIKFCMCDLAFGNMCASLTTLKGQLPNIRHTIVGYLNYIWPVFVCAHVQSHRIDGQAWIHNKHHLILSCSIRNKITWFTYLYISWRDNHAEAISWF